MKIGGGGVKKFGFDRRRGTGREGATLHPNIYNMKNMT
tara:strand:- start:914 stop:1027 length:114 start_codon:yes stop_codon:yes gene_type:complete